MEGHMSVARMLRVLLAWVLVVPLLSACSSFAQKTAKTSHTNAKPTVAEAEAFMKHAEEQLLDLSIKGGRASWVQENFITDDTEVLAAQANEVATAVGTQLALDARRFDGLKMPAELARKFLLFKLSLTSPPPNNTAERKELTEIATSMDSDYGKSKYCKPQPDGSKKGLSVNDLSRILATSTNPDELLDAWVGWHKIPPAMRQRSSPFVDLSNKAPKEMGFQLPA